ncbi:MAG: hypothetical protein KDD62_14325 [Bdellovibrionales bacterium]|nr:hypothetical protein [Bdellovibrionales bacterium]
MNKHFTLVPLLLLLVLFAAPRSLVAANNKKLRPKLINKNYVVGGVLESVEGPCQLFSTNVIVGSSVSASANKSTISVQSFASIVGKLKKNGKYSGEGIFELAPTISFLTESLKGRFRYNRKTKQVTFAGTYTAETTLAGQRDCLASYTIRYESQ